MECSSCDCGVICPKEIQSEHSLKYRNRLGTLGTLNTQAGLGTRSFVSAMQSAIMITRLRDAYLSHAPCQGRNFRPCSVYQIKDAEGNTAFHGLHIALLLNP